MGGEKCEVSILPLASLWNFVADVDGVVLSSTPSSISSFVGHEDDEEPPFEQTGRETTSTCITYSENVLPAVSDSPRPLSLFKLHDMLMQRLKYSAAL